MGSEHRRLLIETATVADLDAIVSIEQACFSAPWTRKMLEAELVGNQFSSFLVARLEGEPPVATCIVGYLCFWVVFEELRIMNVAVTPSARRQGIARQLVTRALDLGRERAASKGLLEVRASNVPARRLYGELGFREVSIRSRYYTHPIEDAILMEGGLGHQPACGSETDPVTTSKAVCPTSTYNREVRHDDGRCDR